MPTELAQHFGQTSVQVVDYSSRQGHTAPRIRLAWAVARGRTRRLGGFILPLIFRNPETVALVKDQVTRKARDQIGAWVKPIAVGLAKAATVLSKSIGGPNASGDKPMSLIGRGRLVQDPSKVQAGISRLGRVLQLGVYSKAYPFLD